MNKHYRLTKALLALLAFFLWSIPVVVVAQSKIDNTAVDKKVDELLHKLTLKEKIKLLGGTGFTTEPIPRLGIPPLKMDDGPIGVRWGKSTAFPSGTDMAASWDTALLHKVGEVIGQEVKGKGRRVILGPNVNIARNPRNGRTFEAYGEDPFLTSQMAVNFINGVQSQGVAATVKHFVANSQEYERMNVNSEVGQRALHEIFFPAFKAAVQQAHVLAIMPAYNKLNGTFCAENHYLLTDVLRKDWGFRYLAMSDWGAVHATMPTETSGLDLEMPTGRYLNEQSIMPLIKEGKVSEATINEQVRHILRVIVKLGLLQNPGKEDSSMVNTKAHQQVALQAAKEGIVLLENKNHTLPLNLSDVHNVTVIGPGAKHVFRGGGSAMAVPYFYVTPWEALQKKIGNQVHMNYFPGIIMGDEAPAIAGEMLHTGESSGAPEGLKGEYFNNNSFSGKPVYTRTDKSVSFGLGDVTNGVSISDVIPNPNISGQFKNSFSMRWTGYLSVPKTGTYYIDVTDNNGMDFYFNGKKVLSARLRYGIGVHSYKVDMEAGKRYPVRLDYFSRGNGINIKLGIRRPNNYLIKQATEAARKSDLVLAFVGRTRYDVSEGHDLTSLRLPGNQDELLNALTKANPKTVVVISTGEAVEMDPWNKQAGAVVDAWFGGEEAGNAIADVLMGDYNPSGKLPLTFPYRWDQTPASKTYAKQDSTAPHQEGILVGYRYFDAHHIKPLYPFGYGLSYTTFHLSNVSANKMGSGSNTYVDVHLTVKNTGNRAGAEVAQVYIHKPNSKVKMAPHALKGFSRVYLKAGQSREVTVKIPKSEFAYYDVNAKKWTVEPGAYEILVGTSSRDLPLHTTVNW